MLRQEAAGRASVVALSGALLALSLGCGEGTIGSPALGFNGATATGTSGGTVTSGGESQAAGSTTGGVATTSSGEATTGGVATVDGTTGAALPTTGDAVTAAAATGDVTATAATTAAATTAAATTAAATTTAGTTGAVVETPDGTGVLQDLSGCIAPAGLERPTTVAMSVALLNALPKPTTPACYLAALARPIAIVATSSTRSAQPAGGDLSPRVFVIEGPLNTSFSIAGEGAALIEWGEFVTPLATLKGELPFPLTEVVDINEPFDDVARRNGGTRCSNCHGIELESQTSQYVGAFYSAAFRPNDGNRNNSIVSIDVLTAEWGICNATLEPTRCSMLEALLSRGAVTPGAFPADIPTFQGSPDTIIDEFGNTQTIVVDTSTTTTGGTTTDTSTATTGGG